MITERKIKQLSLIYDFMTLRQEVDPRLFEMGMFVPEVALISGHMDVQQLFRYSHLNPEHVFKKYEPF